MTNGTASLVERSFRAAPEAVPGARDAVDGIRGAVPGAVREDVALLVSELVTNSVRHAELSARDEVALRIVVAGGVVRVEVSDSGPGFSEGSTEPSLLSQSGWGLYLVGQLSSRWGIERDSGTTVWFEIHWAAED
jgi:anti-sigma regulatory factor (Ser/Thr protein kinase)